jgi:hypothetical protein
MKTSSIDQTQDLMGVITTNKAAAAPDVLYTLPHHCSRQIELQCSQVKLAGAYPIQFSRISSLYFHYIHHTIRSHT